MEKEAELVSVKTGEIVVPAEPGKLVFGTSDPEAIISRATAVANRLAHIVESKKLYKVIGPKKFVYVEGWTAMLAMLGIFPNEEYCRRVERPDGEVVYEAKVLLKHISGTPAGAGEAICSNREQNWRNRDEYTIKSMAQTRAVGKAARLSFSWIMVMAGYEGCNAEEISEATKVQMPKTVSATRKSVGGSVAAGEATDIRSDGSDREPDGGMGTETIELGDPPAFTPQPTKLKKITEKQRGLIFAKCKQANLPEKILRSYLRENFQIEHTSDLDYKQLDSLLDWIERFAEVGDE